MGTHRAPDEVVRVANIGDPIPRGLVDGVPEGALTVMYRDHFGPQGVHTKHFEFLTLVVHGPHVHRTVETEHGAYRGGGHAMLPRPHLGDDPRLANALGKEGLTDGVVDLVRSGVGQILPLEPNNSSSCQLVETITRVI